jgi:hypothetical protein
MEPLAVEHYPLFPSKISIALTRQIGIIPEQWYEELMIAVQSLEKFHNRASPVPEFAQDNRQLFVGKSRKY